MAEGAALNRSGWIGKTVRAVPSFPEDTTEDGEGRPTLGCLKAYL